MTKLRVPQRNPAEAGLVLMQTGAAAYNLAYLIDANILI